MSYPNSSTINQLNQKSLDSSIKWTPYLGQMLSLLSFVPTPHAAGKLLYNNSATLSALSPYNRGATLPKHSINTTLISEPFERFADMCILDIGDIVMANGVDLLTQQLSSIAVRILREFNNIFFNGNGISPNLKGINLRADTTINVGGPLTLDILYQLKNSITPATSEGLGFGGNVFCSNSLLFRKFLELLTRRAIKMEWVWHPKMNVKVCSVFGMLWVIDENIPTTALKTTVYALNLDAIQVLYACCDQYPTNEWGLFHVPIPTANAISELGGLIQVILAIRNEVNSVGKAISISV